MGVNIFSTNLDKNPFYKARGQFFAPPSLSAHTNSTAWAIVNKTVMSPIYVPLLGIQAVAINAVSNITNAAVDVWIYNIQEGFPKTRVKDLGIVDCSIAGIKEILIPGGLEEGYYYTALTPRVAVANLRTYSSNSHNFFSFNSSVPFLGSMYLRYSTETPLEIISLPDESTTVAPIVWVKTNE